MNGNLVWGATVVAVAAASATAGYFFAKKHLDARYAELLSEEIEATKEYYAVLHKGPGFSTPEEAAKTLGVVAEEESVQVVTAVEALSKYQGNVDPAAADKVVNIFSKRNLNIDTSQVVPEEELLNRSEQIAYIITGEEFEANEEGYDQVTYTWYEGDKTLAGEQDEILSDVDNLVGQHNLQMFGHRSGDNNIVNVRNDTMRLDIQIVRSQGEYAVEVAGFQKE